MCEEKKTDDCCHDCHSSVEDTAKKVRDEILGHINIEGLKDINLKAIGRDVREFIRSTIASGRVNVLMVRVSDDLLESIDALVKSDLFRSRSEAAAFLLGKGVEATNDLFSKVKEKTAEIEKLRSEIRDILGVTEEPKPETEEVEPTAPAEPAE